NEISLQQFENLPFVRSLFFRYNLNFSPPNLPAVLVADGAGTSNVSLRAPNKLNTDQRLLLFHYNLKFYDSNVNAYDGCDLKRFVMQSTTSCADASQFDLVHFRIHLPCSGDFLLDIFAHETTRNEYLRGKPLKFKSVCKWKIIAPQSNSIMVPLPECAGGEWGPEKARRLFFMRPLTHQEPIVNHSLMTSSPTLKISFKL
uniref:KY-like immunoglobulin-like domain-containing protein n=1 Tax=Romanomermis culicivorax TaxID=13658 RepID=A0A915KUT6_ROMCU